MSTVCQCNLYNLHLNLHVLSCQRHPRLLRFYIGDSARMRCLTSTTNKEIQGYCDDKNDTVYCVTHHIEPYLRHNWIAKTVFQSALKAIVTNIAG